MTSILHAAVISLSALPGQFHLPDSFAKPPPQFSMRDSGHANRSGPFVFQCSLFRLHGLSSILPSCAVPGLFHRHESFAKPHPGHANRSGQLVFECLMFLLQLVEESSIEWRNKEISCCQSCEQALWCTDWCTDGRAPRKMQSM